MSMSTLTETPCNRVIRRYAITPAGVQGRKPKTVEIALRYEESQIVELYRDSNEAHAEAMSFARRRGMLSDGVDATVVCVQESLRRA